MSQLDVQTLAKILGEDEDLLEDAYLEHYGVKGMHWGIRKEEETSSRDPGKGETPATPTKVVGSATSKSAYMKAQLELPKPSPEQQAQNVARVEKKFVAKHGLAKPPVPPLDGDGPWRPTKKQVAVGAAGLVTVGLLGYAAYKYRDNLPFKPSENGLAFSREVAAAKKVGWGQGFITKHSYAQEEFTLPAGHVFHRISSAAEDSFRPTTFATSSTEDFHRYLSEFRYDFANATTHHVTWKAATDIKIPSLTTRLDTLSEVLKKDLGREVSHKEVLQHYQRFAEDDWKGSTPASFFKELASKGYHGIVDDMDAGVYADRPLVLFSPESMTAKTSTVLKPSHYREADRLVKPLTHSKAR